MNETPRNIIKIENELYETTNVVRSIGMGLRAAKDTGTILIVYGDLVFNRAAIEKLNLESSSLMLDGGSMSEEEVGCIVNKEGYLESIMYDLPDKWAQIGVFRSKELKILQKLCWDKKNYKKFGFEIINSIIEKGGSFKCVQGDDIRVVDIDSSKDIKRAVEILK
jgi:choline kinase